MIGRENATKGQVHPGPAENGLSVTVQTSFRAWTVHHTAGGSARTHLRGTAYRDDCRMSGTGLASAFPAPGSGLEAWETALRSLAGFFAVIRRETDRVIAAADRVRSIPLFYGRRGRSVFLGDDAEWVRRQVGDREMDPVAREEFRQAGYVTGPETLFPNVRQLQAGEMLIIDPAAGRAPALTTRRYYRYQHREPADPDEPAFRRELTRVTEAAVRRLIDYAGGRRIVVPLSGGFDSRLIAAFLKKSGYGKVTAFSFGLENNLESRYSRRVAEALGVNWLFVAEGNPEWKSVWPTEECRQYRFWASGWSSLPFMRDWLAVRELVRRRLIPEDCVFVPGHGGDFVAGSRVPKAIFSVRRHSLETMARTVREKLYHLAPPDEAVMGLDETLARISRAADKRSVADVFDFADGLEKWKWQERQAKFIVNSVRVYEHFGQDWWLPLWDDEFVRFCQGIPLRWRKDKWYEGYVKGRYAEESGRPEEKDLDNGGDRTLKERILMLPLMRRPAAKKTLRLARGLAIYAAGPSPSSMMGMFPRRFLANLTLKGYSKHGIRAKAFLDEAAIEAGRGSSTAAAPPDVGGS